MIKNGDNYVTYRWLMVWIVSLGAVFLTAAGALHSAHASRPHSGAVQYKHLDYLLKTLQGDIERLEKKVDRLIERKE